MDEGRQTVEEDTVDGKRQAREAEATVKWRLTVSSTTTSLPQLFNDRGGLVASFPSLAPSPARWPVVLSMFP